MFVCREHIIQRSENRVIADGNTEAGLQVIKDCLKLFDIEPTFQTDFGERVFEDDVLDPVFRVVFFEHRFMMRPRSVINDGSPYFIQKLFVNFRVAPVALNKHVLIVERDVLPEQISARFVEVESLRREKEIAREFQYRIGVMEDIVEALLFIDSC
jgi:hypothetical protein